MPRKVINIRYEGEEADILTAIEALKEKELAASQATDAALDDIVKLPIEITDVPVE